jgi:hypothetical protein
VLTRVASERQCAAVGIYPRPWLASGRVIIENKRAVGAELSYNGVEPIMAGDVVLSVTTVHSPTFPMHSGVMLAAQMGQPLIAGIVDARLTSCSVADSYRGTHMSSGMSHRRPLIIVNDVSRVSEVHLLAVGTCAIN